MRLPIPVSGCHATMLGTVAKHRPHVARLGPTSPGRSVRRALLGSYFRPIVRSRERARFSPCTPFGSCCASRLSGGVSSRGCCSSPRPCMAFAGSPRSLPISSWSDPSASPLPPWAATQASVGPSAILCGGVLGEDGAGDDVREVGEFHGTIEVEAGG